jgi:hypothetical protein
MCSLAHVRHKFFELADIAANARRGKDAPPASPMALEAVVRIDALFEIERAIAGQPPGQRPSKRNLSAVARKHVAQSKAGAAKRRHGGEYDTLL